MSLCSFTKIPRPATAMPLLVLLLAACGGGGGGDGPAPETAVLSAGATAPAAPVSPGASVPTVASARSSAECLAQASFDAGYVLTARTRATDGTEILLRTTTVGPATRAGVAMTEFRIENLSDPTPVVVSLLRVFAAGDVAYQSTVVTGVLNGERMTFGVTLTPAVSEGFSLAVGESRSSGTLTARTVATAGGRTTQDESNTLISSTRFHGFETVTVPAGTFVDACRIEVVTTRAGVATTTTTWYANRLGVTLKVRNADGSGTDLVGAAIGGQWVAGTLAATPAPVTPPPPAPSTPPGTGGGKR
jgi:hypothetical protein